MVRTSSSRHQELHPLRSGYHEPKKDGCLLIVADHVGRAARGSLRADHSLDVRTFRGEHAMKGLHAVSERKALHPGKGIDLAG